MNQSDLHPKEGQQYAFEINLESCTGCKGCVTACHNLNGLQPEESWRTVGVMESVDGKMSQTITTSCHHCLEPACMQGCPTQAYIKDEVTGIVKHLDDQCIGCQYCILRCPYEAPKWIPNLKIVRKCDMCVDRLVVGEETACRQGCPNDAIQIVVKSKEEITNQKDWNLPVEVDPKFTFPSTQYIGENDMPQKSLQQSRSPEEGHLPLVLMLVFTQLSVGIWGLSYFLDASIQLERWGLATLMVGLIASIFHLGHPEKAYRAFLGFKTSWLSREVVFFGLYAPLAMLTIGLLQLTSFEFVAPWIISMIPLVKAFAFFFGVLGIYSSAKLYETTPRVYWKGSKALFGFPLTGVMTSSAFALAFSQPLEQPWLFGVLIVSSQLWLSLELKRNQSNKLLSGPLVEYWKLQQYCLIFAGLVLPAWVLMMEYSTSIAILIFYGILAANLFERYLFFRAGIGPRMPKGEAG